MKTFTDDETGERYESVCLPYPDGDILIRKAKPKPQTNEEIARSCGKSTWPAGAALLDAVDAKIAEANKKLEDLLVKTFAEHLMAYEHRREK